MEVASYKAEELFEWVTGGGGDFSLLDVRNNEEFGRFKVEGPSLSKMINSLLDILFLKKRSTQIAVSVCIIRPYPQRF